jgi:hypothetical protein
MRTLKELENDAAIVMRFSHSCALAAEELAECRSLREDDAAGIRLQQAAQNLRLALAYIERACGERKPLTILREAS